jgi:hypothetical protein
MQFFNQAQSLIGGQNSLTTGLVGSGLGALGGYGVGKVMDNVLTPTLRALLPKRRNPDGSQEEVIGRSHWAPALAMAGGAVGAVPGLVQAGTALATGNDPLSSYPWPKQAESQLSDETGALFVPSIPVDAFNRAVWASTVPNPFGTKSQWGDNTPSLQTPPAAAAVVSGLVSAAGAARNSDVVSPWDVAQVAARLAIGGGMGALAGAATGLAAGKILGGLAGLEPAGQQYLQQTGLWAGALGGIAQQLF